MDVNLYITLPEAHRSRAFEIKVIRIEFGLKREEVVDG
jgi:hypothetical protein